jgi:L-asparaginase II
MANPVLVEVSRGGLVESRHRGSVALVDAEGATVLALGDVERPVFPRSAVKALQALPLVETGVADAFGLSDADLALVCASHAGEPAHVAGAAAMLRKAGRDETCLECGAHWPLGEEAARHLAATGKKPGPLHNNCSGKHAGFVCLACELRAEPAGYVRPDHPVQRAVRATLEEVTGVAHRDEDAAIDGCSVPTYAVPLTALARGFARFGCGVGLSQDRGEAARRLRRAVADNPAMVAGTGRFDTAATAALGERAFVKVGAEGVYCAALPELGLGVALKVDDGSTRAAEVAMAALLLRHLPMDEAERSTVSALAFATFRNWTGLEVGAIRPGPILAGSDALQARSRSSVLG